MNDVRKPATESRVAELESEVATLKEALVVLSSKLHEAQDRLRSGPALRALLMQMAGALWAELAPSREVDARVAEAIADRILARKED